MGMTFPRSGAHLHPSTGLGRHCPSWHAPPPHLAVVAKTSCSTNSPHVRKASHLPTPTRPRNRDHGPSPTSCMGARHTDVVTNSRRTTTLWSWPYDTEPMMGPDLARTIAFGATRPHSLAPLQRRRCLQEHSMGNTTKAPPEPHPWLRKLAPMTSPHYNHDLALLPPGYFRCYATRRLLRCVSVLLYRIHLAAVAMAGGASRGHPCV
jgi:hypothetical protein